MLIGSGLVPDDGKNDYHTFMTVCQFGLRRQLPSARGMDEIVKVQNSLHPELYRYIPIISSHKNTRISTAENPCFLYKMYRYIRIFKALRKSGLQPPLFQFRIYCSTDETVYSFTCGLYPVFCPFREFDKNTVIRLFSVFFSSALLRL